MHCALLFGLIGPSNSRFWWVPSPDDNAVGVGILFFIGVVHIMGVGVISFQHLEQPGIECNPTSNESGCVFNNRATTGRGR